MYLKSIEIQGFKSFANKIRFEFHNGITGIVGPNGSGKSNVADAVRWVLGEQRVKQLRGSSMQDVIFAGTQLRKPLGFAYVAITFDNADHKLPVDYEEVTIARRIYRSGESEYLLNGTQCRLRDVHELFYDTGVGKEGYSIIGQGQIDKILSDKPEDRRELFDEAAGIVKFKRRKDSSLKKLASEQENLVRINDILSELEKQVPSLEKQSEKAKIYLKEKEVLKRLDVNAFLLENTKNLAALNEIEEKKRIAEEQLISTRKSYEDQGEDYGRLQERIQKLEEEIDQARSHITQASVVRKELEGNIRVYEEQIRSSSDNIVQFEERTKTISGEIEARILQKEEITARKEEACVKLQSLKERQKEAQETMEDSSEEIRELSSLNDELKKEVLSVMNERANIKSTVAALIAKKEQLILRGEEIQSRLAYAKNSSSQQDSIIEELRKKFAEIGQKVSDLQRDQKKYEIRLEEIKSILISEDDALRNAQLQYHQDTSKLDALVNLTERYEGYGGSVRKVMQNRSEGSGVIGVVADLLKTDSKYETAIEVALGGNIQNVVVRDTQTAKKMIELLKKERSGRATFLPLNGLAKPQEFKNRDALLEPGVIGVADQLVTTQEEYRAVALSLLGRSLIVDTYQHAVEINRKYRHTIRMVTLDGELFMPGGAISGGAYKNNSNLLGRRREMAELREQVAQDKLEMDQHEQNIEEIKDERKNIRVFAETARREQQNAFLEQNTVRVQLTSEQDKKNQAASSAENLERERAEIAEQSELIAKEVVLAENKLAGFDEKEEALNVEISEHDALLAKLREREDAHYKELSGFRTESEKLEQSLHYEEQSIQRLDVELYRYREELSDVRSRLSQAEEAVASGREQIRLIHEQIESSAELQDGNTNLLKSKNSERDSLSAQLKKLIESRDQLSWDINRLDKENIRLQAQGERVQDMINSKVAYMWEEYEVTLSDAKGLRDSELSDLSAIKKEIAQHRATIKNLGSVNVDAIEEYRELMERYQFLKTQHDDLVTAADSLMKIIDELDGQMRAQFRDQFDKIQSEFDKVFKLMFGGGKGVLELMDDSDILEAGVKVIAQPPGKKLQNMMQLSGGEKALTAIALLFAIQNLKPSPFCLLDEIEAALDENNVTRFAQYLHKLTQHTQFIVITHRRGTMEEADRLYGITMQEKGVSALVSVDLIDENELAD